MSYLYVNEQGASVGINGGRIEVRKKDELLRSIPSETIEVIQVFGNINVTTPCIAYCLKNGVNLIYYSSNGRYFGRLSSKAHVNVGRQRRQAALGTDIQFCLQMSQQVVEAKVRNQIAIIRRYARRQTVDIELTI